MANPSVVPRLSPRRAILASFTHAYAVAVQLRRAGGLCQFVIETGNPIQPFRIATDEPANDEHVLARVA